MTEDKRLGSWKEIGAYLDRDERTVRRWEKTEALPVHRHSHRRGASVYAYPSEIDAWREARKVLPVPPPPRPLWKMPAFGLTMALCLVMVGNGLRPQQAEAQASAPAARRVWTGSSYGPVALDGRYAPYAAWVEKGVGIHDLRTGADRILRTGEVGETVVLSPGNKEVVYTWFRSALGRYVPRLLNLEEANAKPRDLFRGDPPAYVQPRDWTPDGKQIFVVQRGPGSIWQLAMVSVQDGAVRVVKSLEWGNEPYARLSPHGRFIAYTLPPRDQSDNDIFILAVDGSSESAVVEHPSNDFGMVWSADGSRLLFVSTRTGSRALWSVPVKDGKAVGSAELVANGFEGTPLGMAQNGTLFYSQVLASSKNVYRVVLDADGKPAKPPAIATTGFVNQNADGRISPDGQRMIYVSDRPEATVMVKDLKTGEEREVPNPAKQNRSVPQWMPDSRGVLVTVREKDRPGTFYFRVDVATGLAQEVLRGVDGRQFAPSSEGIFLARGVNDAGNLDGMIRYDARSGRSIKILPYFTNAHAVSPDGKQMAYIQSDAEGVEERWIGVVPTDGGNPREVFRSNCRGICTGDRFNTLAWTPDGKYLVFVLWYFGEGKSTIWRVPTDGGQAEKLLELSGELKTPSFTPDGKSLFFTAHQGGEPEVWTLENFVGAGH